MISVTNSVSGPYTRLLITSKYKYFCILILKIVIFASIFAIITNIYEISPKSTSQYYNNNQNENCHAAWYLKYRTSGIANSKLGHTAYVVSALPYPVLPILCLLRRHSRRRDHYLIGQYATVINGLLFN